MRPYFIQSKAEQELNKDQLDLYGLYAAKMRGMYKWKVPDEFKAMPEGYIEDCAFYCKGFSVLESKDLGWLLTPIKATLINTYGVPISWSPAPQTGMLLQEDMLEHDNPPFWQREAPCEMIRPFVESMSRALAALRQNLLVMGQPVIIECSQQGKQNGVILSEFIKAGDLFIPMMDKSVVGASVLDLKGDDHTQNLIATYRAMDSEALAILGINNAGAEKASGVTTEETLSGSQECSMVTMQGLELRRQWCARIEERTGLHFEVDLAEGYQLTVKEAENEEPDDKEEKE